MIVDRQMALDRFGTYVAGYNPSNPRISLKIAHTYRVASLCDEIAPYDNDLAWLCGLLHDIGRFEQVRRFDTFNDSVSVSHARLGAEVLFDQPALDHPLIRDFVEDSACDELIRCAILTHSDYRLPSDLDDRTLMLCNVLRDADKIDILKVNCICPIDDIYGVSEDDMTSSELSPAVVDAFYEHRTIPRGIRQYPADVLVSHICFAWELVYPQSVRIMLRQGYLQQMLGRSFSNPSTQQTFSLMAQHMTTALEGMGGID